MWRWKSIAAAMLIVIWNAGAQEVDSFAAIFEFMGTGTVEGADPEEVERLEGFIEHPLRINMANVSRIRESGLLTQYQMASLMDYRSRHGDVLSLTELSALDGFGHDFVRRLSPFISLETNSLPGQSVSRSPKIYQKLEVKGGVRSSGDALKEQYAMKYRMDAGESLQASIAFSKSSAAKSPDALAGSLFWYFRRYAAKAALGNFNARFGQGLALWNGMSLSGLDSPSAYLKRSSNLSPSSSYTGNYAFKGAAAEMTAGKLRMTFLTALTGSKADIGLMPAANLSWLWSCGQCGLTHYADFRFPLLTSGISDMKTSYDIALTVRGLDLFAEAVYDWKSNVTAALAGVVFPVVDNIRMASLLRYYPYDFHPTYSAAARALTKCKNEYGVSVSSDFSAGRWVSINGKDGFGSSSRRFKGTFSVDAACFPVPESDDSKPSFQLKSLAEVDLVLNQSMILKWRMTERIRSWGNPFRTDLRLDIFYFSRILDLSMRTNLVNCESTSFLLYAEGTVKRRSVKFSLRSGVFLADSWNDRIYAYERDLPGSFNVPAFYGRGYWLSLIGHWKFSRWGKIYLRGSLTRYPLMEKKKPGKAELKLMLEIRI